jgi:PAS domain S-box-containing protein
MRVLVVEDSPTQAEVLRTDLEGAGYEVELAASGEEGIARFDPQRFHVVVSDIVMPGAVDGYELCRRIKAGAGRHTPVILLTSLADPLDIINGLECGADNFLTKPHQLEHLLERMRLLLATKQARTRGRLQVGVEVFFLGRKFTISSEREQILDLLISTFEDAVLQNRALRQREEELEAARAELARYTGTLEARLERVLASVPDILYSMDPTLTVCHYVSPACLPVLGSSPEEVCATPGLWAARVYLEDRPAVRTWLEGVVRSGRSERIEYRVRHRDGSVRWLEDAVVAVVDAAGAVERLDGIARDITDRKLAEATLQVVQGRLAGILDMAQDAIISVDKSQRIILFNRGAEKMFGYATHEVLGKPVEVLLPSRFADAHRSHIQDFGAAPESGGKTGERGEASGRRKDGTEFPAEASISKLVQEGETIFTAIVRDVTERQRTEQARAQLATILEATTDFVGTADIEGRLVYLNQAGRRMVGIGPAEDIRGLTIPALYPEHERPRLLSEVIPTVLREGAWSGEAVFQHSDGREIPVLISTLANQATADSPLLLSAIARDLTEYKRLEHQFRLAQKMEAVGRLAGGIAHDFNNVLTAITGYTELLLEGAEAGDPRRGDLEEIRTAAQRAAGLTRQLLAFSRQQVLEPRVFDLNEVVAGMDKMLRPILGEDVELTTSLAADLGRAKADPGQIEQVILNLAVNARDAMPRGGKLTVETANVELDDAYAREHVSIVPGRYVMLAVSDTGMGMDAETKARIFEPFFTTKVVGKGTGLGLATAYGIVKQSGGNVWVYSEPGKGATFKVYLPRVDAPVEGPAVTAAPTRPVEGTETILVTEDNESVRRLVGTVLKGHGYTVLEAAEPAEALALAERHGGPVALLVTDVVMPGMSGRELARQLEAARPDLRVLYTSGYTDDAVVSHGVLEAGVAFLQKPFTPADLLRKVRAALEAT